MLSRNRFPAGGIGVTCGARPWSSYPGLTEDQASLSPEFYSAFAMTGCGKEAKKHLLTRAAQKQPSIRKDLPSQ